MDGIDSDMILEVPDTPDRLISRRSGDGSSKPNWGRENLRSHASPGCGPIRKHYIPIARRSSWRNMSVSNIGSNDTEFLFKEANLARQLSDSSDAKPSSHSQCRQVRLRHAGDPNGVGKCREVIDTGREEALAVPYPTNREEPLRTTGTSLRGTQINSPPSALKDEKIVKHSGDGLKLRGKGKGIDLSTNSDCRTGCISLPSSEKNDEEIYFSSPGIVDQDSGKGTYLLRDSIFATIQPTHQRITGQKRLVRNGCISPLNIEHSRIDRNQKETVRGNDGTLSNQVCIISPDSNEKLADKIKGKTTILDVVADNEQPGKGRSQFSRRRSVPGKEVSVISDKIGDFNKVEDNDRRTGSNHMRRLSDFPSCKTDAILTREAASNLSPDACHDTAVRNESSIDVVQIDPEATSFDHGMDSTSRQGFQELQTGSRVRGKRKLGSSNCQIGECSSSISSDTDSSGIGSSCQPLNSRPTRTCRSRRTGPILGPIIEVDELQSPEAVPNNLSERRSQVCTISDCSVDREQQLESDELLARQLQEEFYNETPRVGSIDELDASIAVWLQGNEGRHDSFAGQHQPRRRDASSSSSNSRSRHSGQMSRGRFSRSTRMAQLRRNFTTINTNMRPGPLGFLTANAYYGGGHAARSNDIHHIQRDFNEDDYEMLLALDESNHQHVGASERQINNLPETIIQNLDNQEACTVCLEPPAIGDAIRHLPCLHKFHKECIDAWLRRKRSCPICKYDV